MKKIIIVVIAVVILLILGIFYGIVPMGGLFDDGTETESYNVNNLNGNFKSELLQPNDKKVYILSHKGDGHSESISVRGKVTARWTPTFNSVIHGYYYRIYLKKDAWSDYVRVSYPGDTKKVISNPNPDTLKLEGRDKNVVGNGKTALCEPYDFTIIGNEYANGAIKAELWVLIDVSPFDLDGQKWFKMASDEAYLYSGYGGLYLPRGLEDGEDRPYDTFEIGQEVKIRVETAKGGYDEEGKPWRVTLNEPYNTNWDDWDDPDEGGGVIVDKSYANDVTNGVFSFTVTEEMARKSMESSDPYSIRIWNVLLPLGTLYVDFLDFIALAPDDVEFDMSDIQAKVGDAFSIGLSSSSDLGIDYFRVSVIYGTNDVLLPSDPLSKLWLINTNNVGGADKRVCTIPQTISFIPKFESFVTVHAKAFDVEGRGSVRTRTYTVWAYEGSEVPVEIIEDETGEEDYGGGTTPGYMPWDPSGGNWEQAGVEIEINWIGVLVAFLIVLGMVLVGFFVFKDPKLIIIMAIVGIIIAVLVYALFFTDMFI